ncbi:MAG: crotonase/enoyl-CoA hydratase family protein [Microthrixaceae bacterium]|nr:crotonase/enoyl-CoA hydratase family protein [Microthrixaceae bacterium]
MVKVSVDGPVFVVSLDVPERRNAVDRVTADGLIEAFKRFQDDESLSVAVLTGEGGTFCAGADLSAVAQGRGNRVERDQSEHGPMGPTRMQLSKPVIAAVEGYAVAGGLELAIWCDLRVAASDAIFGVFCRRWGVPLVDGGTVRLPRLIGQGHAMDLILTGRAVGAVEAAAMGLVNRVVEPGTALAVAVEMAHQMAAFPQSCLRSDRRSAIEQWDLGHLDAMTNETALGIESLKSPEMFEAVGRFIDGEGRHGTGV